MVNARIRHVVRKIDLRLGQLPTVIPMVDRRGRQRLVALRVAGRSARSDATQAAAMPAVGEGFFRATVH